MLGSLSRENKDRHERAASYAEHSNCRLFRRDPRIFFTDRIHKGVEQQILAAGLRYRHSGFNVLHFGYLAEGERWEAKQDYYYRITSLAVQEAPLNTHLSLQMGIAEITARKNAKVVLEYFEQAVRIDPKCYECLALDRAHPQGTTFLRSSHQDLRLCAGCL
jgi:hypothetical protein